ncbi:hypothetical protein F9S55_04225 [Escherichia coli]|uniref:hypothetical protein n=1 Tax=Klebsiella aerogenes TaxID=548 RepID=UPI000981E002|nr:hypothetical protein [Klebsiella aerogenes]EFE7610008.1 hypothetical protein [Escherichia coli]OQR43383.1 hypothetical protein BW261_19680 [Klebsiella aerogenes]
MNPVNSYYIIVEVFLTDIDGNSPSHDGVIYFIIDVVNGICIDTFSSFDDAVNELLNILGNAEVVEDFKEKLRDSKFQFYSLCVLNNSSQLQSHHALLAKNDIANSLVSSSKLNKKHNVKNLINTSIEKHIIKSQLKPSVP